MDRDEQDVQDYNRIVARVSPTLRILCEFCNHSVCCVISHITPPVLPLHKGRDVLRNCEECGPPLETRGGQGKLLALNKKLGRGKVGTGRITADLHHNHNQPPGLNPEKRFIRCYLMLSAFSVCYCRF